MSNLKPISTESIPRALDKAERYRLLNEPFLAESICLDVLAIASADPRALTVYVLAMTDQFGARTESGERKVREIVARLPTEYDRTYYSGIVAERRGIAALESGGYGGRDTSWHYIREAMALYEKADALQTDPANDDAILRYNTCVRFVEAHKLTEPHGDGHEHSLE